jgi:mono/diheme cytochrome c family protein
MLQSKRGRLIGGVVAALAVLAFAVPVAFGHGNAKAPKLIGNPTKGKAVFTTTCSACHTLKAAKSVGTIGPNLDKVKPALTEAKIIVAIQKGGAAIMTKAALAKYATRMVSYKGALTKTQINDCAAFVYTSTHPKG